MSIIKGSNVILNFYDLGEWKPLACARSCSLITNSETGETSTLTSGNWRTYRAVKLNWNISFDGLVSFDMNMAVGRLREVQFSLQPIQINFDTTDDNGVREFYTGYVIVTTITTTAAYNGLYEYSGEGQGTGPLTSCVSPSVSPATLPDAQVDVPYSVDLIISGTPPFTMTPGSSPAWMDVDLDGNIIHLTGTPVAFDESTGNVISFVLHNCGDDFSFSDTIDVLSNCVPVGFDAITLPDAQVGIPYSQHITLTGDAPFEFTTTLGDFPSWMTAALGGDGIDLTGTPAPGDEATGAHVSIFITNCEGGSNVLFDQTINVLAADNINWTYANDVGVGGRMRIIVDGTTVVDTTVNNFGSFLAPVGAEIIVIVNSTLSGTAEIDIAGPYTNSTSEIHITTDEFTIAAGNYDIDGRSLS